MRPSLGFQSNHDKGVGAVSAPDNLPISYSIGIDFAAESDCSKDALAHDILARVFRHVDLEEAGKKDERVGQVTKEMLYLTMYEPGVAFCRRRPEH